MTSKTRLDGTMDGTATGDLPQFLSGRGKTGGAATGATPALPRIPVLDTGPGFPLETLLADEPRAHALLDAATRRVPLRALRLLDDVSRRWLAKWDNEHLPEIDAIAQRLGRPGTYFLSVQYEWACTCIVKPAPDGHSARLVRVLDWSTQGLGRNVMAARVAGEAGPYVTLTWPGYTGVIQGMAPGRFSGALNQAPMRFAAGLMPIDWVMGRAKLWQMPYPTAAHVMRRVFDHAQSFDEAKHMLTTTAIAAPCIYSLAGINADETCVIERTETTARVFAGEAVAANHWQPEEPGSYEWRGRSRGIDSKKRSALMPAMAVELTPDFSWLAFPVLNHHTRLVMVADAKRGELVAKGYEADGAATQPLQLAA
jgi:hypothetical protein